MISAKPSVIKAELKRAISAQLVPMLHGSPGIGKSDIIRSIADELDLLVIDFRTSQCGPEDFNGLPFRTEDGRSEWLPPRDIPLEGDKVPDGYKGWLLFMDEVNHGSSETMKAMFKVILDRMVGQHNVHEDCYIVAAGNKSTDGAIVTRLPTPLMSRFVHFEIEPDFDEWVEWAHDNRIDGRIPAFLTFRNSLFWKFDPATDDSTFPCPRTWAFASRLINGVERPSAITVAAAVGEGAAHEFGAFIDSFDKLPRFDDIINHPKKAEIPEEASVRYALCALLIDSEKVQPETLDNVMTYLQRMDMENQFFVVRAWQKRRPQLLLNPCLTQWMVKFSDAVYS